MRGGAQVSRRAVRGAHGRVDWDPAPLRPARPAAAVGLLRGRLPALLRAGSAAAAADPDAPLPRLPAQADPRAARAPGLRPSRLDAGPAPRPPRPHRRAGAD